MNEIEIKKLTNLNIEDEHICCAISDKKCLDGYQKKKGWLKTEFKNGYNFQKVDVRGKVFIEYVPIESSWLPFNGKKLLQQCMNDAKRMDGIVAISSDKKRPFMTDPKFIKHQGFEIIDEVPPYFKLWGLKTNQKATYPKIIESAKLGTCPDKNGITAYYSNTCPFTDFYTNQLLREYAKKKNVHLTINYIQNKNDGHKMPIPWIINSIFYKGELVTLEMKPDRHLDKII